jgi:hypothetical protein
VGNRQYSDGTTVANKQYSGGTTVANRQYSDGTTVAQVLHRIPIQALYPLYVRLGHNSSVGIATRLRPTVQGNVVLLLALLHTSSSKLCRLCWGLLSFWSVRTAVILSCSKAAWTLGWPLTLSLGEVENEWSSTLTPPTGSSSPDRDTCTFIVR